MMGRVIVVSRLFVGKENLEDWELRYYILKEVKFYEEWKEEKMSYGIEIEKVKLDEVEKNSVEDITCNENTIKKMMNIIVKNQVLPVHLKDVVEDMIS